MTYPDPTSSGYYYAKLVRPRDQPQGDDWRSSTWEIVEVFDASFKSNDFAVFVLGISPPQRIPDFIWGPRIIQEPPV